MTEHEHTSLVRTIFDRVSERPLDDVRPDTRITDLGIDSVTFAEIVVQIEEALDIDVPFAQWLSVRTVQDVLDMIDESTGNGAGKGV
jgi:acyl carrier protein